ncbi:MAG: cytochrome C [Gammaproteobacteria bacterium]|nr:cytochrome C [Gammaproteobacteria bacterium]
MNRHRRFAGGALLAALCFAGLARAAGPVAAAAYRGASTAELAPHPGVSDPRLAWQDWVLNCQGCHRPNGDGSAHTAPKLAGEVARYLRVPGGRAYLARIPGIASSPLDNRRLASVVNWMLWRFDPADLPADFRPFTAEELGRMRSRPWRLGMYAVRRALQARIAAGAARGP